MFIVENQFLITNSENELLRLKGSLRDAIVDCPPSYWQLSLSKASKMCKSFITFDGMFSPTRVLHGTKNTVTHLRSTITSELDIKLRDHLLVCLDDLLLYDRNIFSFSLGYADCWRFENQSTSNYIRKMHFLHEPSAMMRKNIIV